MEEEKTESGHWYWRVLEKHGLPTFLLLLLIWMVVLPMKDALVKNMDAATLNAKEQMGINKTLAEAVDQQVDLLQQISSGVKSSNDRLEEHSAALEGIEAAVRSQ